MGDIWSIGLPILLVDVANPVLLAAVILALTTSRPYHVSLALILGHMVAYFSAGMLIVFGLADLISGMLGPFLEWFNNPAPLDYLMGLLLGAVLIWVAWRWKVTPPKPSENPPEPPSAGIGTAFGFGALINFIGIPFALPYFAFINELYKLDAEHKIPALLIYNGLYSVPFLLVPAALAVFGDSAMPALQRINAVVEKYSAYIMPAIVGLLGLTLLVDGLFFFATGQGLY